MGRGKVLKQTIMGRGQGFKKKIILLAQGGGEEGVEGTGKRIVWSLSLSCPIIKSNNLSDRTELEILYF